ncbi:T9SS type A sorting domain-containing protein [Dyadobacter psychrotolerans]|uniref:T9SS type A sorting domain-containing protein n=1 Tax=Dyadobacter psychrotolerans TaxID=2541721 RepID=A0A4R5DTG8_9BACT|nr:T9SS type A sorting domain-containing protein [Dyadobacter psychrotolerans]TDE14425.1 T9SS type A sorting domain-containing protein [Dyadobacter psychrotolerans]
MKKIVILILLLSGMHAAVIAQCDPNFGANPTYTGTSVVGGVPTILVGQTGQLNFTFGVGTSAACNAASYNTPGNITLVLSFTNNYAPTSANVVSGPMASLFDWFYDPASKVLIGTSNAPIPVGPNANFTVNVVGTAITAGTLAPLGTINYFSDNNPPITNTTTGNDTQVAGINVDAPLPVTLSSFMAGKEGAVANLSWETTEESNSDRFEIERSLNGNMWRKIGLVQSAGESKVLKSYAFTDRNPESGDNLYRLRIVDKDDTFAYSRIRSVKFEGLVADLSVYPNPVVDKLFLRDFAKVSQVVIYDMGGRSVFQSGSKPNGELNVKSLKSGAYVVHITRLDGTVSTQRIVINK